MEQETLLSQFETSDFLQLNLEQLCELLADDKRADNAEAQAFKGILKWMEHNQLSGEQCLPRLLPQIRIERLETKCILSHLHLISYSREAFQRAQAILKTRFQNPSPSRTLLTIGYQGDVKKIIVEKYCPAQNQWTILKEIDEERSNFSAIWAPNKLIIIGGFLKGKPSKCISSLNLDTLEYTKVDTMSYPRASPALVVYQDYIYVIGGYSTILPVMFAIERIPLCSNNQYYKYAHNSLNVPRYNARAAVLDDYIYIIGGCNQYNEPICSVERFDLVKGESIMRKSMSGIRHLHGVAALNGQLYAVGGSSGALGAFSTVERYNPKSDTWTKICSLNRARKDLSCIVYENRLLAIGGLHEKTIEEYNNGANVWHLQDAQLNGTYECLTALTAESVKPGQGC